MIERFENHYSHCGVDWIDRWDSACNDRCSVCNKEIEPHTSVDLEAVDRPSGVVGVAMPIPCWTWENSTGPGNAYMRKSAEGAYCLRSDVEKLVMELDYFRSGSLRLMPSYVPSRIRLLSKITGDGPFRSTFAPAGEHPSASNRYGAISIAAENGRLLGVKPGEFVPIEWIRNPMVPLDKPVDEVRCKCLSAGPDYCPVHAA